MFIVEIFDGTNWNQASSHTLEVDALAQKQRFLDGGQTENTLRISQQ